MNLKYGQLLFAAGAKAMEETWTFLTDEDRITGYQDAKEKDLDMDPTSFTKQDESYRLGRPRRSQEQSLDFGFGNDFLV